MGVEWAARALDSVGVSGTDTTPIGDSEAAFARGQHLNGQLFMLSQLRGRHDRPALLGRLGAIRRPMDRPAVVEPVAPQEADLLEVGGQLGEALYRLNELGLGDIVTEATRALMTVSPT